MTDNGSGGTVKREDVLAVVPSLEFTDKDTTYHLYRMYIPMKDTIEWTLIYREPGKDKMRIDMEIGSEALDVASQIGAPVHHSYVRILHWGKATEAYGK